MSLAGSPVQSFSETLLSFVWISRLQKSEFKDSYERSAGSQVKEKESQMNVKTFFFWSRIETELLILYHRTTKHWHELHVSKRSWVPLCAHVCPRTHTQTCMVWFTHTPFSLKAVFPLPPHGFLSFHFFLFFLLLFLSLSLFFCFFDISKLAVQEMAETATSLFLLKKSMLILLLAVITYPRTHS